MQLQSFTTQHINVLLNALTASKAPERHHAGNGAQRLIGQAIQLARRRKHFGSSQQRAGESLEDCRVRLGLNDVDRMERTQRVVNVLRCQKRSQR